IFFEDINFAADGGLYAEMVQNRSFEFTELAANDQKQAWSEVGTVDFTVVTDDAEGCLNDNNPNYAVLTNTSSDAAGIANSGWLDGMAVTEDAGYDFSIYVKSTDGYSGEIHVAITVDGEAVAEGDITGITSEWTKYELELTSSETANSGVMLEVTIDSGSVEVDMISLFPQDTYNGRSNGMRKDLAEKLEELSPSFLRFPGGCVVEGATIATAYSWKDSIGCDSDGNPYEWNGTYGDVAARKQGINIWTDENTSSDAYPSFMSYGLGFYEYFLLAEDIGAIGVPVINAGMCCMGQSNGSGPSVDSEEFQQYIQDALDLVEFCRGDETTTWGAVRIAMGHEDPFELKYIGIGNEQWGDTFFEKYVAFVEAFEEAREENPEMYGDIELMFTAGTDDGDSGYSTYIYAYTQAYTWLQDNPDYDVTDFAGAIDHHYYNTPDWFLSHTDYYDPENYSRDTDSMLTSTYGGGISVFLGEYAAQSNTWQAALAEAAYMTGLERNGDIVVMAAYAPLFGNLTALHWAPDLIWFDNDTVTCSVNYYVQKIFSKNAGTTLLSSELTGAEEGSQDDVLTGAVGLGTWSTAATFDNLVITDNETGEVLASDDFSDDTLSEYNQISDGSWSIEDGQLVQSSTAATRYSNVGSTVYYGDTTWTNYTMTVEATKTGGDEGFLIPFAVQDADNNYFWNVGGWSNTVSCLQEVSYGTKSDAVSGTSKSCTLKTGQTYTLKIVVSSTSVQCYIDDVLYVDYDVTATGTYESYQVVSTDDTGDIIIKLVNVTGEDRTFAVDITGADSLGDTASVDIVAGDSLSNDNILGQEEVVTMKSGEVSGITNQFNYTVPEYSVTVIRISREG
ncbi:MAG: hypothetical protein LIO37_00170, partial [Clostridiales bacterium]|nr:hypothetical protein [Clostridiales bacterium]